MASEGVTLFRYQHTKVAHNLDCDGHDGFLMKMTQRRLKIICTFPKRHYDEMQKSINEKRFCKCICFRVLQDFANALLSWLDCNYADPK